MRCRRHLWPSRSIEASVSRTLRPAASRAGVRRHLDQRRQGDPYQEIDGARGRHFHQRGAQRTCPATIAIGHTRYSTAGDTVDAQCAAVLGGIATRAGSRSRTTATSPTRCELRAELEARGRDFPGQQRHRSDPAPGGALARTHAGRRVARCSAATRRRVLAGLPGAGPHHRGARSARLPSAGHGANRAHAARSTATSSRRKPARST